MIQIREKWKSKTKVKVVSLRSAVCFNSLSKYSSVILFREKVKVDIGSKSESHLIAARDMQCMMADKCVQSIGGWLLHCIVHGTTYCRVGFVAWKRIVRWDLATS